MYIGRFKFNEKIFYGKLVKDSVIEIKGDIYSELTETDNKLPLNRVKILAPTVPTKIVLVGLNYQDHAKEMGLKIPEEPVIFMKPNTAVIPHNEGIVYPMSSKRVDYEAELAFVIKKQAHKVKMDDAADYILGYTCLNDVTARDLQKKDGQWIRAKSFNTFAPFGPYIYIPENKNFNPNNLEVKAILNGEIKQHSNTKNFIFPVEKLVEFISNVMTLYPGDVVSTGTPSGIGPMKIGDVIEIEVEKVGKLKNHIIMEEH